MRIALAASLTLLVLASGASAQSPTLTATVGPGFTIRLNDASGAAVKHLDPGTYTVQVADQSDVHNFHLTGPGVDRATDIEQVGSVTWTITVSDGTYRFQCDAHPATLFGSFTVGNAPPPPPAAAGGGAQEPSELTATVGPGKKIALILAGVKATTVKVGPAVFVVHDRSAADNFHLTGPGVDKLTAKAGTGTVTWRVTLKKGLYRYRSDATPRLSGSFRVL